MQPKVRAVFTMAEVEGKTVVSAEIPAVDIADRPCFYAGKGRNKGSYVRVGDSDEPMTEYEIYSYEAFRRKYEDEIAPVPRAGIEDLDADRLSRYVLALKDGKPNLSQLTDERILELMSVVRDGRPTLAGVLLFCPYPQAFFPQLGIVCTRAVGDSDRVSVDDGVRFADSARIEGTLSELVQGAMAFVRRNMRTATRVSPTTGGREDILEYPLEAVREVIVNAVVHRDYSIHTQGMPIQLTMSAGQLEVANPGGLYGRITVDQLGHVQPDTRNPVIATTMETLKQTENRYSGIPTIRRLMAEVGSGEPLFEDRRGAFAVTLASRFARSLSGGRSDARDRTSPKPGRDGYRQAILDFCDKPRTREQIAGLLGIGSVSYAITRYVRPLVESGELRLGLPRVPNSRHQTYVRA